VNLACRVQGITGGRGRHRTAVVTDDTRATVRGTGGEEVRKTTGDAGRAGTTERPTWFTATRLTYRLLLMETKTIEDRRANAAGRTTATDEGRGTGALTEERTGGVVIVAETVIGTGTGIGRE
jgi:hypothetical protein